MEVITLKSTTTIIDDYSLDNDVLIICNSATAFSVYLKSAVGKKDGFYIKNIGAGDVTVTADGSDLIDGAATKVLAQYDSNVFLDYDVNTWILL